MRAYLWLGLSVCVSFSTIRAQDPLRGGGGVDAKGVRHTWNGGPAKPAPYVADTTKRVPIHYPYEARQYRREGAGLFRLHIDLATGKVIKVTVLKSTRVASLDNISLSSFRRYQFKPGTWKEIDIPVAFTMEPARR